jgi:hypothetical protein
MYFRTRAVGGKRFGNTVDAYVQHMVPGPTASYDSSLAVILLKNAADAFKQTNLDAQHSKSRDGCNLRELANVVVKLGNILEADVDDGCPCLRETHGHVQEDIQ